jgi:hypothetical protein
MKRTTKFRLIAIAVAVVAFLIAWWVVELLLGTVFFVVKIALAVLIAVVVAVAGLVLLNRLRPRE